MDKNLKNKKVLLMGLGVLGGGVATARWLLEQGAALTITDIKNADALNISLEKLKSYGGKIKYVLGRHEEKDFLENEIIVLNPDIPVHNSFVEVACKASKQIKNELTLFYKFSESQNIIAITCTRGKTTTANWTYHFLKSQNSNCILLGNDPEKPFLNEIKKVKEGTIIVMEVPSYQLELVDHNNFRPHVALITNIYRDHINRHKTMEEYAGAKANIFIGQQKNDILILNRENEWTEFFLNKKPKSQVSFTSENSIFTNEEKEDFKSKWGEHNLQNLLASSLAALSVGVTPLNIKNSISTLPQIKFREEKVYDNGKIEIYNDTSATSPDATVAALERFTNTGERVILITGGTDRELDFSAWAVSIKKLLRPDQIIFLSGSATEKMKKALGWQNYKEFDSLEECVNESLKKSDEMGGKSLILFSPSSKSFEKFKNEFDRGEQFNLIIKKLLK